MVAQNTHQSLLSQRGLANDRRHGRAGLDMTSAMFLAQKMIFGPATSQRRLVAKIAIAFASQNKAFM